MHGPAPAREVADGGIGGPVIVLSIVMHVLAFIFAVGVPRLLSSGPSGNKVYVVDLVSLPGSPAPAAPAPPAAAAPAPEPPKPAPVKPPETKKPEVKKEPPKKAPVKPVVLPDKNVPKKPTKTPVKPPEKKPAEPEPTPVEAPEESGGEEEAAAAAPTATPPATAKPGGAAGTGTGAGAGAGSGTGGGDEYDFYIALLQRRIEAAWKRPVSTSREIRTASVYFELSPTGRLLKLELKTPSGYAPFDRSIMQAVRDAEPFPAFPLALKMDRLTPTLQFELTPLAGDAPQ
ncbi:MAG TPA: TonB family protein [Candidatus Polarisedimenticolia bacterium]|nr:TonB family protein [Candidatus Polarisedimenticolia bacterium]